VIEKSHQNAKSGIIHSDFEDGALVNIPHMERQHRLRISATRDNAQSHQNSIDS
jgi:hypothetical protein